MNKKDFVDNVLFERFKDEPVGTANDFRRVLAENGIKIENITNLFVKITNYQLKKYGTVIAYVKKAKYYDEKNKLRKKGKNK